MKKLTPEQKKLIQYLYSINSPFSINELTDAFNCSTRTIYRILNSNNTTINNSLDLPNKQNISQINKSLNLFNNRITKTLNIDNNIILNNILKTIFIGEK